MRDESNLYWVWLAGRVGIGSKEFAKLVSVMPDPYDVYRLSEEEIEQLKIGARLKQRLCDKSLTDAYDIIKYCKSEKVDIIGYSDKRYPARLRNIEDPPVLLYCKGKLPDMNSGLCFGMVGTRKMSEYGKRTSYKISYELSAAGVCIVSGMASGIDGVCACGAMEAGGNTVAVLGNGISITYPKEHGALSKAIRSHGAVITEFPPYERPLRGNFPKRNRIISGLCQGVLVVEGVKGSGALITAKSTVQQGRELFALPGQVSAPTSEGPNELICEGANVARSAQDIIDHYDFLYHDTFDYRSYNKAKGNSELKEKVLKKYGVSPICEGDQTDTAPKTQEKKETPAAPVKKEQTASVADLSALDALDEETRKIYGLLPDGVFTADALTAKGVAIYHAMTALTMLEISGLVKSMPGGAYKKL